VADRKHERIAADLREQIRTGALLAGSQLPSVAELAEHYGVSGETLRHAMRTLQTEGLIEVRHGVGTYVRSGTPIVRSGADRLAQQVWGTGHSPWELDAPDRDVRVEQLAVGRQPVPAEHAAALDLPAGTEVVSRSRVYTVDGRPVMAATSYLPVELAADTAMERTDTGPGGIYARLAEAGHRPVRFVERLRCRPGTSEDTTRLRLPAGTYVLHIVRTAYNADGRPVELADMVADPSVYVLSYEFDA
jgi:GntR family transcriptional regulator